MSDYAKGFKDGFAAGLEEGRKIYNKNYLDGYKEGVKQTIPPPYVPSTLPNTILGSNDTCPKCGIKTGGVMGYVCSSINCPTYYKTWTGPAQYNAMTAGSHGAVGSMSANYESTFGTNGPAGPSEPPDNNSVWVNGSWVSLGN